MQFPLSKHRLTGTALPVSCLKTQSNPGVGEFLDLIPLGRWCQSVGIGLIQILPVNDTGYETSPYSALSAFALHPLYVRLDVLQGADRFADQIATLRSRFRDKEAVAHKEVLEAKLQIFQALFLENFSRWSQDKDLAAWIDANPWVPEYAVFCTLKSKNQQAGWQSWAEFRSPQPAEIGAYWKNPAHKKETLFHAWLQYEAEKQFRTASQALDGWGVALKGDIPILLNEDSADVWAHPELFDMAFRAGSPPMGGEPAGQNWGFPTYRWTEHRKDGFSWWRARLGQANKFYHAYRIDHVVGFFRIWNAPAADFAAVMGTFNPSQVIRRNDLAALGFDDGRIQWLSQPHVPGSELRERLGEEAAKALQEALVQVGNEDLFRFRPDIRGERHLAALPLSDRVKGQLYLWFRNRTLLDQGEGTFRPLYTYHETRGWSTLSDEERRRFGELIEATNRASEALWKSQGEELMEVMKSVPMLVCAEDLGAVPDCVPEVLAQKKILGLKIVRWARAWSQDGQPFLPVRDYSPLSVCTPAVHDTSTLRQWWEEGDARDRFFTEALGREPLGGSYTTVVAESVVKNLLEAQSFLCIFQIQDFLALTDRHRTTDPERERINWPGTVSDRNWSYKMKPSVEDLEKDQDFSKQLRSLLESRNRTPAGLP